MLDKIEALLNDEDFMMALLAQDTAEDVKALFLQQEIELSDEYVENLGKMLVKLLTRGGELPDEDLAEISGGRDFGSRINFDFINNLKNDVSIGNWLKF